jgi:F-type H+-transporting ATPase subunit b
MAESTEHAATAGETHESTGAEHGSGGLPQFQFQHWGGQIAYLLVLFVILYLLISRVFTPRLRGVIDQRAATIAGALEAARQVQAEAASQAAAAQAEVAEARARSQRLASDARAKASAEAAARQATEDARLGERMAEAEARIQASRDAAMKHVGGIAAETAAAIVEKLTGKAASGSEISNAISTARGVA